jgi:hypothetical protein
VDRLDNSIRRYRQEAVDLMRPRYLLRLGAAIAVERRPDAGEGGEGTIIVEREPDDILFLGLGVRPGRVFGEAVERDQAAIFRLNLKLQ